MSDNIINKVFKRKGEPSNKQNLVQRIFLGLMATVGSVGFSLSPIAHATSDYDSVINPATSLMLVSPNGSHSINATTTYLQYLHDECESQYDSMIDAVTDEDGVWIVTQVTNTNNSAKLIEMAWTTNPAYSNLQWSPFLSGHLVRTHTNAEGANISIDNSGTVSCFSYIDEGIYVADSASINSHSQPYVSTFNPNYPVGYEGEYIPDKAIDVDEDGLTEADEEIIGTDPYSQDTDGDGISDKDDSFFKDNYFETYCYTSCADPDPLKKDVFIEVDWMNDGVTEYKPSTAQLEDIEDMFTAHNINIHFDMGEYGGGNELPIYAQTVAWSNINGQVDLTDLKFGANSTETGIPSYTLPPQFDFQNRLGTWRYMVIGDRIDNDPFEVEYGLAEPLGDAALVAYGKTYDDQSGFEYNFDRNISGVIAHEIGHLLCLTHDQRYEEQDEDCVFGDVDTSGDNDYQSLMNYKYAFPKVLGLATIDYSNGGNGSNDHDDWTAIEHGMGAFILDGEFTESLSTSKNGHREPSIIKSTKEKRIREQVKIGKLKNQLNNDFNQKYSHGNMVSRLPKAIPKLEAISKY